MHVLLDARTATPKYPGIGRYAGELAEALRTLVDEADEGRLTVVVPPVCTFGLAESERCRTVVCSRTPTDPRQQREFRDLLERMKPDLYHSPYYLMANITEIPTVLTMHDIIPLMQPAENSAQARIQFRTSVARALKASARVISVSETTRRDCAKFFPDQEDKFITIPHGVDPRYVPCTENHCVDVSGRLGIKRPVILYLGSNRPHKNITALLSGYAHAKPLLKGHELVIAGYGSGKSRQDETILKQHEIEEDVKWIGAVSETDMPSLFSCASAFVLPSLYEGFGLPVLEAMATGTPVACSDTPSLRELGGDSVTYFNPRDPADIAQALVACVTHESARKMKIASGLARAANYRWSTVAAATWKVYSATLGSR